MLCSRLFSLANERHEIVEDDQLDATLMGTPGIEPSLDAFPGVINLGLFARLVGSAVHRADAERWDVLLPREEDHRPITEYIAKHTDGIRLRFLPGDTAEGPHVSLYDVCVVRNLQPEVVEVLPDSSIAMGEFVPFAPTRDVGWVNFPTVVQRLAGGTRLQVHFAPGRVRLFASDGKELTDDPSYMTVTQAFSGLEHPERGIFEAIYAEHSGRVEVFELLSWDGGTTFRLPLRQRLALLDKLASQSELKVTPWRWVDTPYEMYELTRKVVAKDPDRALDPADHGWVICKDRHIQPGRPAPWLRCAPALEDHQVSIVASAEAAYDLLDANPSGGETLILQRTERAASAHQLHMLDGKAVAFTETYGVPIVLDTEEAPCYTHLPSELPDFVLNVLQQQDGRLLVVDCLHEKGASLHAVPLAARLRIARSRLLPRCGEPFDAEHWAVRNIQEFETRTADVGSDHEFLVRRADGICDLPDRTVEVIVRPT